MKNFKYTFLMALLAVGFTACEEGNLHDEPEAEMVVYEEATAGTADFSKYVAVGASFTAGFSDGALFQAAQANSFPSIMAQKMAAMGGGAFNQPMMNDNLGGLTLGGNQITSNRLFFDGAGPAVHPGTPTTEVSNILSGSFNNFGIPGAKSFHMMAPGYGNIAGIGTYANPYFVRMASSPAATVLGDAAAAAPTFFTISEIGGNDVLGYALSGGSGMNQTGNFNPATYGSNDITDPTVFANVFSGMVATLTSGGAKGAVVTVPSIVNLPNFTTVPHNPIPLDAGTAAAVNAGYAPYNAGIQQAFGALVALSMMTQAQADAEIAKRTISFAEGNNAVVIIDENLTDLEALNPAFIGLKQYRQATSDDFIPLSSVAIIGTEVGGNPQLINGVSVPLEDKWVLTPEEQQEIKVATDAYNATITAVGNSAGLAVIDLDGLLTEASTSGANFNEFTMTTSLVFGGLVSLDGIHLTTRGYALMANKILQGIDATYGSNFEASGNLAKAGSYPTNYPPGI